MIAIVLEQAATLDDKTFVLRAELLGFLVVLLLLAALLLSATSWAQASARQIQIFLDFFIKAGTAQSSLSAPPRSFCTRRCGKFWPITLLVSILGFILIMISHSSQAISFNGVAETFRFMRTRHEKNPYKLVLCYSTEALLHASKKTPAGTQDMENSIQLAQLTQWAHVYHITKHGNYPEDAKVLGKAHPPHADRVPVAVKNEDIFAVNDKIYRPVGKPELLTGVSQILSDLPMALYKHQMSSLSDLIQAEYASLMSANADELKNELYTTLYEKNPHFMVHFKEFSKTAGCYMKFSRGLISCLTEADSSPAMLAFHRFSNFCDTIRTPTDFIAKFSELEKVLDDTPEQGIPLELYACTVLVNI